MNPKVAPFASGAAGKMSKAVTSNPEDPRSNSLTPEKAASTLIRVSQKVTIGAPNSQSGL